MSINLKSPLLSNAEAANLLKISPETLAVWRSEHRYNIPFIKVGRCVRYRLSDVEAWVKSREVGLEVGTSPSRNSGI